MGHLSGVVGRNPAHVSSMGNSFNAGQRRVASWRQWSIPSGVTSPSKRPGSTVAPITILPSALGTMYVSWAKRTRFNRGGVSLGIRRERLWPLCGTMGTGNKFFIHDPFATTMALAE